MPLPLAALATFLFCAFLALFPAAAGWLQARIPAPAPRARLPADPRRVDARRMAAQLDLHRLSVAVARLRSPSAGRCGLRAASSASSAFRSYRRRSPAWHGCLFVGSDQRSLQQLLVAIVAAGEALRHVQWTEPARRAGAASALLQGNIEQDLKFRPERYAAIARHLRAPCREHRREADRVSGNRDSALPRPHRAGLPRAPRKRRQAERRRSAPRRAVQRQRSGEYYNSVISLGTAPPQAYHKSHLVPFGEFIPPGFGWVAERAADPALGLLARRARSAAVACRRPARRRQHLLRGRVRRRDRAPARAKRRCSST